MEDSYTSDHIGDLSMVLCVTYSCSNMAFKSKIGLLVCVMGRQLYEVRLQNYLKTTFKYDLVKYISLRYPERLTRV